MTIEQSLAEWLPGQRWFAGKGVALTHLAIAADTSLVEAEPGLRHLIVTASHGGTTERYQVLIGLRASVPDTLTHAVIGPAGQGLTAYDALHDPELTQVLLAAIAGDERLGPLRFTREPGTEIDTGLDSLVLTGEQSNTSLLFGEEAILKVFRRLSPGPNPDLEVPHALAKIGSEHVAAPLGWIEARLDDTPTVLAILSAYLRAAVDGWSLAATSVRDLYGSDSTDASQAGGDFAGEATRLGEATAEVHHDLAKAFGSRCLPGDACGDLAAGMLARLDTALAAVPDLAGQAGLLRRAFEDLGRLRTSLLVQRIHGDYHLGQVMRTQTGWVLLDFEGEPAVPLAQRRAWSPPLRDVAGMLRSFEYVARHQLPEDGDERRLAAARDWVGRNSAAFCAGYAQAGGPAPDEHATLLRALTLDKAVYEVLYEARHRPHWLRIPLGSIADA